MKEKQDILLKQLKVVERQEELFLNQPENIILKLTVNPMLKNIEELIPKKLKSTLNLAFYKGFQLVFEKGNAYIEKTYDKDKIQLEYDFSNYVADKAKNAKYLNRLDKQSGQSKLLNSSIAAIEGSVLGVLGIGIPDIPLFLAVIIRNLNEIALSYGFEYDSEEEKNYMLSLICGAMTKADSQKNWNETIDQLGQAMNHQVVVEISLKEQLKTTSDILSDTLLTAKFIQGIPLVGVVGGAVNHTIIRKIGKYAAIKYKKRYLQRKMQEGNPDGKTY